jgi:hypothetical protein
MTNPSDWQAVDEFATGGPLRALEAAAAGAGLSGERFESAEGGRALVLPVEPLAQGRIPGVAVTGAPVEAAAVAFLDPATGSTAVGLLAALGERARTLRVALPPDQVDAAGLVPEAASVTIAVGADAPATNRLFAVARPDPRVLRRPTEVPKIGEDVDVLDQRSKWFQGREGGRA